MMTTAKTNVIELTKNDAQTSGVFNALISTLRSKLGAALYGQSPVPRFLRLRLSFDLVMLCLLP